MFIKQKTQKKKLFRRGFSLVEILVVIAIISIMTGVSILGLSKNRSASKVEIAANQMVAILRSLQNDSINGKVLNNQSICKIKFDAIDGARQYSVSYYDCIAPYDNLVESEIFYLTANGNNSNVTSSAASFSFVAPRGEVSSSGQIALTSEADTFNVCISLSGNIYAQKSGCL